MRPTPAPVGGGNHREDFNGAEKGKMFSTSGVVQNAQRKRAVALQRFKTIPKGGAMSRPRQDKYRPGRGRKVVCRKRQEGKHKVKIAPARDYSPDPMQKKTFFVSGDGWDRCGNGTKKRNHGID